MTEHVPRVHVGFAVRQNDHPSREEVDRVHAQVVEALKTLFEQHKHLVGWEDKHLEIR